MHEREVIEDAEAALPSLGPEPSLRPWWVSLVAGNRDLWQGAALFEDSGVNPRIFFFLFAKKNPQEACFMEVREVSLLWPGCGGILPNGVQVAQGTRKEFAFLDPLRVVSDTEVSSSEEAPIFVYEGLRFQGDRLVASHEPRPFEGFVRFHPRRPAAAPRAGAHSVSPSAARQRAWAAVLRPLARPWEGCQRSVGWKSDIARLAQVPLGGGASAGASHGPFVR